MAFVSALLWYQPSMHAAALGGEQPAGVRGESAPATVLGPLSPVNRTPLDGDSDAADIADDGDEDGGDRQRLQLTCGDGLSNRWIVASLNSRGHPAGSDGLVCAGGLAHAQILTPHVQRHRSAARRHRAIARRAFSGSRRDSDGGGDPDDWADTSDQDDDQDEAGGRLQPRGKFRGGAGARVAGADHDWRTGLHAGGAHGFVILTQKQIAGPQVQRARTRARGRQHAARRQSSGSRQASSDDPGGSDSAPPLSRRLIHPLITVAGRASWSPGHWCIGDHARGETAVPPGIRVATCGMGPGGPARCSLS